VNKIDPKSFTEEDSEKVDRMSVKDSLFVRFLDHYAKDSMLFTVQEKCMRFTGSKIIASSFSQLIKKREEVFARFFKDNGTNGRVKFNAGENGIPYSGFSYFKINYKGEIPDELNTAYRKLNNLNEESPRKRYLRERKKMNLVLR